MSQKLEQDNEPSLECIEKAHDKEIDFYRVKLLKQQEEMLLMAKKIIRQKKQIKNLIIRQRK